MENTNCAHCGQAVITPKQRLRASHWQDIYCSQCGGRMAMQPIVMSLLYFTHTWNVFFFGFMAIVERSVTYFGAMIVCWLLLEFFGYYIPLVRLKKKIAKA